MRVWYYALGMVVVFLSVVVPNAFANTINVSSDPAHAQQFSFYCGPYKRNFETNKHYTPIESICTYSIPSTITGQKIIGLYKGVPGDSVFVGGDLYTHSATLVHQFPNNYGGTPQPEDNFFAVIYPYNPPDHTLYHAHFTSGTPLPAGAQLNYDFYIIPWKWGPKPVEEFEPVIVIPGILGSWEKDGEWVLDPISHVYTNLVDTLLANDYIEGETLFKFPYDWRKSNIITAELLKDRVSEIQELCNCTHVDIVAHSMGGLVASQYVSSDSYENNVDQMIFLGTPMAGAPKAYKTWESGEVDFGSSVENTVMQRMFTREARDFGFNSVFDYIHAHVPSVGQLLPAYSYLKHGTTSPAYPAGHPQNTFVETMFSRFPAGFEDLHLYVVIGNAGSTSTVSGFITKPSTELPKWEHGEVVTTNFAQGDGTVPRLSSTYVWGPEKEFEGVNHTDLVAASSAYVFETLSGRTPAHIINESYGYRDIDYDTLIDKLSPSSGDTRHYVESVKEYVAEKAQSIITITGYSPINIEVVAPNGAKIGTDTSTGNEVNEIPGAVYSGPDAKYETILILDPLPGEYRVNTVGTGAGDYTIAVGYTNTSTTSVAAVSGTTVKDQVIENALFLSPTTTLTITEDTPLPPVSITPDSCIKDMRLAYQNSWIKKKQIYNSLVADCTLLKGLFERRDATRFPALRAAMIVSIKFVLDDMAKLAKDKSNTKAGRELILKNVNWFRKHELK